MTKITLITGDGKGKTSTSIGHAYLNLLKQKKIVIAQFLKTGKNCGECNFFKEFHNVKWLNFGKDEFYLSDKQLNEFKSMIAKGIAKIYQELSENRTDILILDELGVAFSHNLARWNDFESLITLVEEEIIITGRRIPEEIEHKVDRIILIEEVKHPYSKGIKARKGIEF